MSDMETESPRKGAHTLTMRATADLTPYARNPRTHTDAQVEAIARSITRFGFTNPILLDGSNGIIAGHGRLRAAVLLGMAEVPCIDLEGLSEAERRAYIIADNQLALNAGWDQAMLAAELTDLSTTDVDLKLLGFSDAEMAVLLPNVEPIGMPALPDGDKSPFQQITFTLFHTQADTVDHALRLALGMGDFPDSPNDNRNGNALARICEMFVAEVVPQEPGDGDA